MPFGSLGFHYLIHILLLPVPGQGRARFACEMALPGGSTVDDSADRQREQKKEQKRHRAQARKRGRVLRGSNEHE